MTEVDFYLLPTQEPIERNRFACRLADKAFRRGHRIYIHSPDESSARAMDNLLWGFRASSFLPHALRGEPDSERIAIGWGDDPGEARDFMINLDLQVPGFVDRFERVAEVVVQNPQIRDPLRQSWKFYKEQGYPIRNNKL